MAIPIVAKPVLTLGSDFVKLIGKFKIDQGRFEFAPGQKSENRCD